MTGLTAGTRLFSSASAVEVIVVTGADVEIECAGVPMERSRPATVAESATGAELPVGKRYEDTESGLVIMVTRPGAGPVTADGRDLTQRAAAALPSSD